MFKQLIRLLEDIYEVNWNGDTPTDTYLELKGHRKEVIDRANKLELIDFSGKNGRAEFFQLTKKGYELLQLHQGVRLNKMMLNHTKTMKKLTWAIFILTIISTILMAIQIYLIT